MRLESLENPHFPIHTRGRKSLEVSQLRQQEKDTIDLGFSPWDVYDSEAFGNGGILGTFVRVGLIKKEDIDTFFQGKERTIVELGGPGHHLSYDLQRMYPGKILQTAGVTLTDPLLGVLNKHTLIVGDLNVPSGQQNSPYDEIQKTLNGQKVDLIVSRMVGGMKYLSKDPYVLTDIVAQIFKDLLSSDGRMLLEIPEQLFPFMADWMDLIQTTQGIDAEFVIPQTPGISGGGLLAITRSPEGPAEMPLLSLDQIKHIYRRIADSSWQESLRQFCTAI